MVRVVRSVVGRNCMGGQSKMEEKGAQYMEHLKGRMLQHVQQDRYFGFPRLAMVTQT